jgi:hypothetical protein
MKLASKDVPGRLSIDKLGRTSHPVASSGVPFGLQPQFGQSGSKRIIPQLLHEAGALQEPPRKRMASEPPKSTTHQLEGQG